MAITRTRIRVDGEELVTKVRPGGGRLYPFLKRVLDVAVSLALIGLTAPLWALIALGIKLESPGPVIFRQRRVGLRGREFDMYKFRSMVVGADPGPHEEAFRRHAEGKPLDRDAHAPLYKSSADRRITKVGRFLRATNVDELPQLINVLKGEMSIVGPRPPIQYELRYYKEWYHHRFEVLQGITGLWQIRARNRVSLEEMVRLDLEYVERRGLLLDLWLMLMTGPSMLIQPRRGAPAGKEDEG